MNSDRSGSVGQSAKVDHIYVQLWSDWFGSGLTLVRLGRLIWSGSAGPIHLVRLWSGSAGPAVSSCPPLRCVPRPVVRDPAVAF